MTQELAVRNSTTVVANEASQLPALQAPVLEWAQKKLLSAKQEHQELETARDEAKKHKWKTSALANAARKAFARVTFYEKVVAALEAGYMLFPPVPNADCIAVRTNHERQKGFEDEPESWGRHTSQLEADENLPIGVGKYKSPNVNWQVYHRYEKTLDNGTKRNQVQWTPLDFTDPEFPLLMGKTKIIRAVSAAMERKVFDEIRMFPFERKRRGDPCLLGTVYDAWNNQRHYFLISWRINEADL